MFPMQQYQPPQQMVPAGGFQLQPVSQQLLIPGLPWRPPFVLNLNVPPYMQEHIQYSIGHVLHELQTNANTNEMRLLLYWTAAQNNWNNDCFTGLVYNVLDYVDYMMGTGQGGQYAPADFIAKGAADACKIMAVQLGSSHPSIMQKVSQQGQNDIRATLQYAQQLVYQIQQYKSSVQSRGGPGNGMGVGAGMGFPGQNNQFQHPQQAPQGFVGRVAVGGPSAPTGTYPGPMSMQGGGNRGNPGQGFVAGNSYNDLFNNGTGGAGARTLTGERLMLPGTVIRTEDRPPVITGRSGVTTSMETSVPPFMLISALAGKTTETTKENTTMTAMTTDAKSAILQLPASSTIKSPFPTKPPQGIFTWEGRTFVHALFADFKPCHAIGLPYGTLHDPEKVVMFYELTDPKAIREVGVQIEVFGGMQPYEDHETHHLLNPRNVDKGITPDREAARNSFMQILQARDIDVILKERDAAQSADTSLGSYLLREPVVVDSVVICGLTNPIYQTEIENFFESNNLTMPKDQVVNFHYKGHEPWTLKGEALVKALELKYSKTWDVLYYRINHLRSIIHPTYWNIVHQRLTDAVNETVTKIMGVQARISHFVEDLAALRAHLRKECGDSIADHFENQASSLALRACFFEEVPGNEEVENAIPEARYNILEDIYLLPCNAEDLTWKYSGEAAVITERRLPELYAALRNHYERVALDENASYIRHTKFITRDGKLTLFANKGIYAPDTYLIHVNR